MNGWLCEIQAANLETAGAALISGALSSSVETVSTAYLGLVRQSVYSLRTYYELNLAWLYYKDHSVEWNRVEYGSDQVSLPAEVKKYLGKNFNNFAKRWTCLNGVRTRVSEDPYGVLSAYVHGGYISTIPKAETPLDLVSDPSALGQLSNFIHGVCEYVSDTYVASHQSNWASLPTLTRATLEKRIPSSARDALAFS